jgi:hypothetical protein
METCGDLSSEIMWMYIWTNYDVPVRIILKLWKRVERTAPTTRILSL